ncbi:alpha-ketoglutarate-dependent dioxygenase AlkB family protein [Leptospira licerasiae]|uniref:2OG-Fe(II) oxygenase family protein n=1 Tax=Leptospira licerasiae str. MMD4847 TaxID=1049971 RepID=A0ABP2RAF4_9LEPT|nr:alpha-ketoglutarate-dependent dioxygenase AlkB [Leptospira licerasiae]EIE02934.1 oxidoreductase, 2OG-Fe(II) oxygenase family protein [Leptospira licerasiae serovar Varillal str. VAR 010]EJZ40254.1 2OG-Fe(II) oxygenase family protein [Leptospira licerasiae str. MMD4847]
MNLFRQKTDRNYLPYDGIVQYFGPIISDSSADDYLDLLLRDIPWKNDEAIIFGKHIVTKRMVAWFGDSDYQYTYSNTTKKALPWTKELSELKILTEEITKTKFNSCLLNLYNNGEEGMAWHSDDEKALGKNSTIASLSFGAERKFYFKHKSTKERICLILEHGSLLVMKEAQESWLHSLPKTKSVKQPRVNLTFRTMLY